MTTGLWFVRPWFDCQATTAGGDTSNPEKWKTNPRLYLSVGRARPGSASTPATGAPPAKRGDVFIEIGQKDPRMQYGKVVEKYLLSIGMHILPGTPAPDDAPAVMGT